MGVLVFGRRDEGGVGSISDHKTMFVGGVWWSREMVQLVCEDPK